MNSYFIYLMKNIIVVIKQVEMTGITFTNQVCNCDYYFL